MEMFVIVLLILFGVLFLVAELVLLPGVSAGAVLSLVSFGSAVYMAFRDYGPLGGTVTLGVVLVLAVAATLLSLRAKTWQRFSLRHKVASSMPAPASEQVRLGDRGLTLSRLADGQGRDRRPEFRGQIARHLCRSADRGRSGGVRKCQRDCETY